MQYRVALDPQLKISASDFVTAWNGSPNAAETPASLAGTSGESFLSPEMMIVLVTAVVSIPTTVIATFISDYLKKKFIDKETPRVSVTIINAPDGLPVWIIKQIKD